MQLLCFSLFVRFDEFGYEFIYTAIFNVSQIIKLLEICR